MEKLSKEEFQIALGENIRKIRTSLGITQRALALDCNMEPASINKIEKGKVNTSAFTLHCICKSLGVQYSDLLEV